MSNQEATRVTTDSSQDLDTQRAEHPLASSCTRHVPEGQALSQPAALIYWGIRSCRSDSNQEKMLQGD